MCFHHYSPPGEAGGASGPHGPGLLPAEASAAHGQVRAAAAAADEGVQTGRQGHQGHPGGGEHGAVPAATWERPAGYGLAAGV